MSMAEGSIEECRNYQILAKDPGYANTQGLAASLKEVSRGSSTRTRPPFCLLAPDSLDSRIPQGYQGRSPWPVQRCLSLFLESDCAGAAFDALPVS
jgi:hypothetical protein